MTPDELFMRAAWEEARKAGAEGEVPIGAVIVRENTIIARAHNQVEARHTVSAHAEFLAAHQAEALLGDWRLSGCTLYVTKEPCLMCTGMLLNARIKRVVFGVPDPAGGGCGGAFDPASLPGLLWHFECTGGVLEEESLTLIREFFRSRRSRTSPGRSPVEPEER